MWIETNVKFLRYNQEVDVFLFYAELHFLSTLFDTVLHQICHEYDTQLCDKIVCFGKKGALRQPASWEVAPKPQQGRHSPVFRFQLKDSENIPLPLVPDQAS